MPYAKQYGSYVVREGVGLVTMQHACPDHFRVPGRFRERHFVYRGHLVSQYWKRRHGSLHHFTSVHVFDVEERRLFYVGHAATLYAARLLIDDKMRDAWEVES